MKSTHWAGDALTLLENACWVAMEIFLYDVIIVLRLSVGLKFLIVIF